MRPLFPFAVFSVILLCELPLTSAALRCYNCNSRDDSSCIGLTNACSSNYNCRDKNVQYCAGNENNCIVTYAPDGHVSRGCLFDPRTQSIENDQRCSSKSDGTRVCSCQVDMCNTAARFKVPVFILVSVVFSALCNLM